MSSPKPGCSPAPSTRSNAGGLSERSTHDPFALQFQLGDHCALAETMHRACTEEGLWKRLAASLPTLPARKQMVAGFWRVYGLETAETVSAVPKVARAGATSVKA